MVLTRIYVVCSSEPHHLSCSLDWHHLSPSYVGASFIFTYLLPIVIILFCYVRIAHVVSTSKSRVATTLNSRSEMYLTKVSFKRETSRV